jgi:hypothetical protein
MQAGLGQVYAHQRAAQQALGKFVGAALYEVDDDLSNLHGHTAPVAAVSMPDLPDLLKSSVSDVNDSEQQMRPIVQQATKQCP